ncbi:serine/threonine protein kinase, partial [Colletotrichum salicis]
DIKPSNILIYQDNATGTLVLKLTDFGLAIKLTNALTWKEGSVAAMSARHYDAPEVRLAYTRSQENGFQELPLPRQILFDDIWKLGYVLIELAVFIIGGSVGVTEFRDVITTETGNISSDSFNDVRFDGEKVKPEVMDYITKLKPKSQEMSRIESILRAMLNDSSVRPSAGEICQLLTNAGLVEYPYHDGVRHVGLEWGESTPDILDQLRLKVESKFENPMDWSPMPPIVRPCREGDVKVVWKHGKRELSVILAEDQGRRYVPTCVPTFKNGGPMLPLSNQNTSGNAANASPATNSNSAQPPQ